jgi:hypothetical protein
MRIDNRMAGLAVPLKSTKKKINLTYKTGATDMQSDNYPNSSRSNDHNSNLKSPNQKVYISDKLERVAYALATQGNL